MPAKKYRALQAMSLRQSPDPKSPQWNEWHEWRAGTVFTPPAHLNIERARERGLIEEVVTDG